eukprot:s2185_g9.t2
MISATLGYRAASCCNVCVHCNLLFLFLGAVLEHPLAKDFRQLSHIESLRRSMRSKKSLSSSCTRLEPIPRVPTPTRPASRAENANAPRLAQTAAAVSFTMKLRATSAAELRKVLALQRSGTQAALPPLTAAPSSKKLMLAVRRNSGAGKGGRPSSRSSSSRPVTPDTQSSTPLARVDIMDHVALAEKSLPGWVAAQAFLNRACSDGCGISKQERLRVRQVFERFKDQNAHEIHRSMDGDASRRSVKASNFLPFDFLTALGSEGVKFLAFKVSPDFDWAESLQGAKLHISQEGEVSLEAPRCKEELGIRPSESEWSQLLCLAPPKQGLAKLKICGRVDAVLQLHRTSKMLSAADSAARITHEELSRQQDAGNKAKRGTNLLLDAWDGSGHAPEVVRRESTVSKGIPAEMLGLKLKMKVVELEAGQSLKVAFWSMGNFCLDGLESVTFTSYQLERPGAKGKTRLQLTGKASDSPGLHVLGHPAKVFPPFDDLTLIAVHLPESRELQICPCALFNIEIDRQGKGYSDPKDPVNLNREEEPVPEEDTGPMTAKQYRDKRKLAIESFGTAKKMRSFGQVAERLDRDLEVANLEQYTGSISARVEEQLKLKQTAEEKDEETKREVLPPFIRSDDPQKIYVEPWKQH